MAEGAVMPVETLIEHPVEGRSLWAEARERLFRNKAAVVSIVLLAAIALACIFGPFVTGHPFDKVYPDYVRAPASLEAYPQADQITPADRAHRLARAGESGQHRRQRRQRPD